MTFAKLRVFAPRGGWAYLRAALGMVLATLLLCALPLLISLPAPKEGSHIATASFQPGAGAPQTVDLPFVWSPWLNRGSASGTFHLTFRADPSEPGSLALLIPAARQKVALSLNGAPLEITEQSRWSNARSGYFIRADLPAADLRRGDNQIELRMERSEAWVSGYLSQLYISRAADIDQNLRARSLVLDQAQAMSLSLHLLLAISIFVILALRRHDAIFLWLSLICIVSLPAVLLETPLLAPLVGDMRSFVFVLQATVGLLVVMTALEVRASPQRRALRVLPIVGAAVLTLLALPSPLPGALGPLACAFVINASFVAAALLLGDHFARRRDWVAAILCPPCSLAALCASHDILLALGVTSGDFMLTPYARFLLLTAVMALLIGHLIQSLNHGDASQAILQQKLAEQEHELRRLHRDERERLSQQILARERERLMRDLHDGISGHLVSILAQAEKQGTTGSGVHHSASEALFDLRLVVQSLDLGEDDMRLALAGFYERLQPQLRRLGVRLDWSMENLPEISGMTSGFALAILRVLQEAVTNALKHGPARQISLTGRRVQGNWAEIIVTNDRHPCGASAAGQGHGMQNMRRRAETFGGDVALSLTPTSASLSLKFPCRLSDLSRPMEKSA